MILALRSRLTLVYAVVFGLLLTAIGLVSYRVLARQLDADATARLTELTDGLHGYLRFGGEAPAVVFDPGDPDQAAFVQDATRYYQVYDADNGALLVQSDALEPLGLRFTPEEVREYRDRPRMQDLQTDYGRIRISNSLISSGAGRTYLLQVGASLAVMDRVLGRFLVLLLVAVPAGLVATLLAGRWMAGVALAPLSRLAATARTVHIGDLRQRLPVRGTDDELDGVAQAFNEALGRLDQSVADMRQFSAALAHELRTPLAALRGEIEMALLQTPSGSETSPLASQLEEIDKLKRLIDQLLTLARAESGETPIADGRVDLGAMSVSLIDQLELVAQAKAINLEREIEPDIVVAGDAGWLERLLLNLVDNALKFTPEGGRVVVRLSRDGAMAKLEVRDSGVGMSPAIVPHVFERFFRADPARSSSTEGVGLGLSLVKWIVDRHAGRIEVQSEPGKGSTFTVRVPLARTAALKQN